MNGLRSARKRFDETDVHSDNEIVVQKRDRNTSAFPYTPTTSSAPGEKRIASVPLQERSGKRSKHFVEEPSLAQIEYHGQENGAPRGGLGGRREQCDDRQRLGQSLPTLGTMTTSTNMFSGTTTPPNHDFQLEGTSPVLDPDSQHPPPPPETEVRTPSTTKLQGIVPALGDVISVHSDAGVAGAIESSTSEEQTHSKNTTGTGPLETNTQPPVASNNLDLEDETPQLGVHKEPRITEGDVKSLQPCKPLTDNALLFGLLLFRHDQVKTDIRERCRTKKDSGPRIARGDRKVQQIIMQLNYEEYHWLFAAIDLATKRWLARDPLKGAPCLQRAREDVKMFLCNEKIEEWTEVSSTETGPWQPNKYDCGPYCIYYAIREMFEIDQIHIPVPEILRRAIHFAMPVIPGHHTKAPFEPSDIMQWMPARYSQQLDRKNERERAIHSDERVVKMMNTMDDLHAEHSKLISDIDIATAETHLVRGLIQQAKHVDDMAVAKVQTELDQLHQILRLLASASAESFIASLPWQGAQQDGVNRVTIMEKQLRELEKNRDYRSNALEAVLQGLQQDVRAYEGMKALENHRWETLKVSLLQRWD